MPSETLHAVNRTDRDIVASIRGAWHTVPAGGSYTHEDPEVIRTLGEYGCYVTEAPEDDGTAELRADAVAEVAKLKGEQLDKALQSAGLPTSGKVAAKRARLVEYLIERSDEEDEPPADEEATRRAQAEEFITTLDDDEVTASLAAEQQDVDGTPAERRSRLLEYLATRDVTPTSDSGSAGSGA